MSDAPAPIEAAEAGVWKARAERMERQFNAAEKGFFIALEKIAELRVAAALAPTVALSGNGYWLPWAGGDCPVPPLTRVDILYGNGDVRTSCAEDCYWPWREKIVHRSNIVAYRVLEQARASSPQTKEG